jgi:protein-tyrosine-phosphatase
MNVLILCHANRWRSALVHGYLQRLVALEEASNRNLPIGSVQLHSAGFKEAGRPAGKPIRDVALELGFSLEHHRSKMIAAPEVEAADLIIHMGDGNKCRLDEFCYFWGMVHNMSKAHCLGEWCTPRRRSIQDFAFIKPRTVLFDTVVRYTIAACQKLMAEVIVPAATKEQAK